MPPFLVASLSHHATPVALREKIAFSAEELSEALTRLARLPGIAEALILSTCNRVELWAVLGRGEMRRRGEEAVRQLLLARSGLSGEELAPYLNLRRGVEAVQHIFRVTCSLDSMVLGEPQILGQVKDAAALAVAAGTTGTLLGRCLERAFKVAKRVRTDTRLGASAVSISSAAVELAGKVFGDLQQRCVMLIGAGEMAELAARSLKRAGCLRIWVANRSVERAELLAAEFGGKGLPLAELEDYLWEADIVISSTGSPTTVLGPGEVERALRRRKRRPVLVVDIAVPRDVDIEVGKLDNVFLYDIDDLGRVVEANRAERAQEAAVAEQIVRAELESFLSWQSSLEVVPLIVSLRNSFQTVQEEEVQRTLRRLGHLPDKDRQAVEALGRAIVNKLLHAPVTELKRAGAQGAEGLDLALATRRLFGLSQDAPPPLQQGSELPSELPADHQPAEEGS